MANGGATLMPASKSKLPDMGLVAHQQVGEHYEALLSLAAFALSRQLDGLAEVSDAGDDARVLDLLDAVASPVAHLSSLKAGEDVVALHRARDLWRHRGVVQEAANGSFLVLLEGMHEPQFLSDRWVLRASEFNHAPKDIDGLPAFGRVASQAVRDHAFLTIVSAWVDCMELARAAGYIRERAVAGEPARSINKSVKDLHDTHPGNGPVVITTGRRARHERVAALINGTGNVFPAGLHRVTGTVIKAGSTHRSLLVELDNPLGDDKVVNLHSGVMHTL